MITIDIVKIQHDTMKYVIQHVLASKLHYLVANDGEHWHHGWVTHSQLGDRKS